MFSIKIIILSAGKGTRLMPLTQNTPKPLIHISDGKTLLETQLERIKKHGSIDEIILVTGYKADQIEAKIKMYKEMGYNIKTIYNPFYDNYNNLISLWLARHEMSDDFIITNGDNIFHADVFRDLVQKTGDGIIVTTNRKEGYVDDDMKVILEDGKVSQVSKLIKNDDAHAESVGLVKVQGEKYRRLFREKLDKLIMDPNYLDKFWLEVLNLASNEGIPIHTFEINGKEHWQEVDFHLDLEGIRKLLNLNKQIIK